MDKTVKNKVTIYMVKEGKNKEDFIKDFHLYAENDLNHRIITISDNVNIFYEVSNNKTPSWVSSFFQNQYDLQSLFSANTRLIVVLNTHNRYFVIAFGYGKNLIENDEFQEDFGIKIVLNTLKANKIRKISKTFIGGNQKASNEQLPKNGSIEDLELDVERDLVGKITGTVMEDKYFIGIITGGVGLTFTSEVTINNISDVASYCYEKYCSENYKENFGWIDYISFVKDSSLVEILDNEMLSSIKEKDNKFWTAVPEIIDWENCGRFRIDGLKNVVDDIYIEDVLESYKNSRLKELKNVDQLKNKKISLLDSTETFELNHWSVYKCIYGELEFEGRNYCLNYGKWYEIDKSFKEEINDNYSHTSISDIVFDPFKTSMFKSENEYSKHLVKAHKGEYILLDRKNITYGGGRSKIEVCDVLTKEKTLIHIKPYSGSSTLSHLFSQGIVSFELLTSDLEFIKKANDIIKSIDEDFVLNSEDREKGLKVVYAIIHKDQQPLPNIPFFSKVALKHAKRTISAMHGKVEVATIKKVN